MNFQFSFKQMKSSEALQSYAHEKINDKIKKFVTKPIDAHITFAVDRHNHTAQCHLRGGDGFNLEVMHTCEDMYGSVDRMVDKLEAQLKRHKEKLKDHKHARVQPINAAEPMKRAAGQDNVEVDAEDIIKYEAAKKRLVSNH